MADHRRRDLPSWFARVAELEGQAFKIHEWELRIIPGLLQTPDYARAIMRAVRPRDDDETIERDVTARISRQEIFSAADPPMAWFVLDESILRRPFGGPHIMRDQLAKLEKMSQDTNVVIQIMPFQCYVSSRNGRPTANTGIQRFPACMVH